MIKKYLSLLLAFGLLISVAVYLRILGLDWDQGQMLHPDERFLNMVQGSMHLESFFGNYFNTDISKMNPHNIGFGFYVYGTLPLFIVKIISEYWKEVPLHMFGRYLSVACDLFTVILVFLIANSINGRLSALLAMFFSVFSVLQIQHAHFGVVDSCATFFVTLAIYISLLISNYESRTLKFILSIIFGVVVGCAASTKINALLVCLTLIPALLLGLNHKKDFLINSVFSGLTAVVIFRVFQPYAFIGPDFLDIAINQKWLKNITELLNQARPTLGFPPAVQWYNRSRFFGLNNMIIWGMGTVSGIFCIVASLNYLFKIRVKKKLSILYVWILSGLIFYGLLPEIVSLRYLLPLYSCFYVILGCFLADYYFYNKKIGTILILLIALPTIWWSFAFSSIYQKQHTRVAASEWILKNLPSPISLSANHLYPISFKNTEIANDTKIPFQISNDIEVNSININLKETFTEDEMSVSIEGTHCGNISSRLDSLTLSIPYKCNLKKDYPYFLNIVTKNPIVLKQTNIAHESSWDDGLPLRVLGYDPYAGLYKGDLNFEMYWDDNIEKVNRFVSTLEQTDYFFITSNRQWGAIGRLAEEYRLPQLFYRKLANCKNNQNVFECYANLKESNKTGFGYELIKTFTSNPEFLGFTINDQYAEEAFTVYDHPKVLIFKNQKKLPAVELKKEFISISLE